MKAFPEVNYVKPLGNGQSIMTISGGMDLRDYFAGIAMQGLLDDIKGIYEPELMQQLVNLSYRVADAMMEARNDNK